MSTSPYLMEPPQGQTRDLVNPANNSNQVIVAGFASTAIALVAVTARVFTRTYLMKNAGLDDYLAIVAMCLSIAFCATTLNATRLGAGKHMWYMLNSDYSPYFLAGNIGITITYSTSVSFSKLSILFLYLRLSPKPHFRCVVYGVISIVIAYTLAYELVIIFQCKPISAAWDITIEGTCHKPKVPMMTLSIFNIFIDFVILVLPVKLFLELQMSLRQRISLIGIFAAGGFVCAVAIQRTIILPRLLNSTDYTWDVKPHMIWGFLEINTGVVCAALPALKPLFTRYLPRLLNSRQQSSHALSDNKPFSKSLERERRRPGNGPRVTSTSTHGYKKHNESGSDDDEVHLWSTQGSHAGHSGKSNADELSMESLQVSHYGNKNRLRTHVSAAKDSMETPRPLREDGITVTRETKIARSDR